MNSTMKNKLGEIEGRIISICDTYGNVENLSTDLGNLHDIINEAMELENEPKDANCIGYAVHHGLNIPDWMCPECANMVKEKDKFCSQCGTPLNFPTITYKNDTYGYHKLLN